MATKGYNLEQTGEQVQSALNRIIALAPATEETDGLMSASDKSSLENLNTEINNKVDKVAGKGLSTNDFTDAEKAKVDSAYQVPSTGIPKADLSSSVQASLTYADNAASQASVDAINAKIPTQASAQNQLADKAFVNSSIATAAADFKGTYDSLEELQQVSANNNDYGYVVSTDSAGNTIYSRYKYNGSAWVFEYDLNNSSFTAAEWAAIQSQITSALVQKLNALPTNSELTTALNGKQATLVSGTNIKTVGGQSIVGSGNVPMSDPDAVKYTAQTPTDAQKTQARTNIGAYAKPSGGIPKTDLASGVQGSLDLADTSLQWTPVGSITPPATPSDWATAEQVSQLEAELSDTLLYNEGSYSESYASATGYSYANQGATFKLLKGIAYKFAITCPAGTATMYVALREVGVSGNIVLESIGASGTSKNINYTPDSDKEVFIAFGGSESRTVTVAVTMTGNTLPKKVDDADKNISNLNTRTGKLEDDFVVYSAKNATIVDNPTGTAGTYIKNDGTAGSSSSYTVVKDIELPDGATILLNKGASLYKGSSVAVLFKTDGSGNWTETLVVGNASTARVSYKNTTGATMYVGTSTYTNQRSYIITLPTEASSLASSIRSWLLSEAFLVINATYTDGIPDNPVNIIWTDNYAGTLTMTRDSDGLVSSIVATHGSDSFTLAVTRDSDGNVTNLAIS